MSKHRAWAFITLGFVPWIVVGRTTIASQFDDDSELLERFEEFEEETGYGNRSKAVRAAIRRGLDQYDEEQQEDGQRAYTTFEDAALTAASVIAGMALFLPLLWLFGYASSVGVLATGAAYLAIAATIAVGVDFRSRRAAESSNSGVSN
jgi:Arc/MetJ-type ribon-helix-helix transcriptional regulator